MLRRPIFFAPVLRPIFGAYGDTCTHPTQRRYVRSPPRLPTAEDIDRIFVGKNPKYHRYWFPLIDGMVMLYANTKRPPLDDVRVRKALSMAIDRPRVVKVAMYDYTRPADATGLSDAFARFRDPEAVKRGTWTNFDAKAASRALDELGLRKGEDGLRRDANGELLTLDINVPGGFSDWVRAGQVIARNLRQVGLDANLRTYDFNAWFEKLQTGEFNLSMSWSDIGPTPYGFFRGMMSSKTLKPLGETAGENWHRFALPQADKLLEELATNTDSDKEREVFNKLQALFVEHAPAIPLFPGPSWGEQSEERFTGFPSAENPYAPLSPNIAPASLLVLTQVRPR